ncbi:MAG TPA: selenocysteine-specific translation elongation factor, partial [Clostridia bacterium]|nr:selenocysteine-specific translation elongation factor [Clostridia bacterium]
MSSYIIGTAGHIDHGKSALVKALTNIETDRFQEEKERGITIDLGFAYLTLENGEKVGIVDVPGHEKFIKNMLAGVSGIDLVLLIVAADESVMPQTKEHIDILRFLDIDDGIICITKKDLVEDAFIELVKEEILEYVEGTFLEEAPMIETSSKTLDGIQELKDLITDKFNEKDKSILASDFRLPIDRAFTLKGLGTVVTGTLVEGEIQKGDAIEIFPSHLMTKARTVQVHNEEVDSAHAGQRVAINIPNISKEEINRGDVIAPKDTYFVTDLIDVSFTTLKTTTRVIQNNTRLRLYIGTTEVMCRISILNSEMILPGETVYAQLKLEESIVCKFDDKFVIRFYSPLETIGGGKVLKSKTTFHKRFDSSVINNLDVIASGNSKEIVMLYLNNHFFKTNDLLTILKYTGLRKDLIKNDLEQLISEDQVLRIKDVFYALDFYKKLEKKMLNFLKKYHKENHLDTGINKEEIRLKIFEGLDKNHFDLLLEESSKNKVIKIQESEIAQYNFEVQYSNDEKNIYDKINQYYLEVAFNPLKLSEVM